MTERMETLGWQSLQDRRKEAQLVMLLKVVRGLGHIEKAMSWTRANISLKLQVYAPNIEVFRNSFFPRTIKKIGTSCLKKQ